MTPAEMIRDQIARQRHAEAIAAHWAAAGPKLESACQEALSLLESAVPVKCQADAFLMLSRHLEAKAILYDALAEAKKPAVYEPRTLEQEVA